MTQGERISRVKGRPTGDEVSRVRLEVFEPGVRRDDDWWYVPVCARQPDIRAFEYAALLNRIEEEFEAEGTGLLLIPAADNQQARVFRRMDVGQQEC